MQDRQGGARDADVLDWPRFVPLTPWTPASAAERVRFRLTGEVEEVGPVIRIQHSDDGVHWKDVEEVPGEEEEEPVRPVDEAGTGRDSEG